MRPDVQHKGLCVGGRSFDRPLRFRLHSRHVYTVLLPAMPLMPIVLDLLSKASHALGFETIDRFPAGHAYARTRWDRAYFDIASDLKPDAIERALCDSIANTPSVFAHIVNPTPACRFSVVAAPRSRFAPPSR